jgi:hypothetical protein
LCIRCGVYRAPGAFPHLVGSSPGKSMLRGGFKRWRKRVRQARESKQRTNRQKSLMKRYGLTHPSPNTDHVIRYQELRARNPELTALPGDWAWVEPLRFNPGDRYQQGAKPIRRRLPRGGWVQGHLFEYRGFCGWTYRGSGVFGRPWIFQCECLRCSAEVSEDQNICCWCASHDSRYPLLTSAHNEKRPSNAPDWQGEREPGKILFRTTGLNGNETSWVGRRKNTCANVRPDRPTVWEAENGKLKNIFYLPTVFWSEGQLPSWHFSWCGRCYVGYVPRKGVSYPRYKSIRDSKRNNSFYRDKRCHQHALDPKNGGYDVHRRSKTFKMHFQELLWWQIDDITVGEPRLRRK